MKFTRSTLAILAAVAMVGLYGCGKSAEPTSVSPSLDGTPPSAPEGFSFAATTSYYRLAWSPSPDADVAKYQVYLYQPDPSRDNSYVMIGETTTSDFALPASISGIEAYFRVRAVTWTPCPTKRLLDSERGWRSVDAAAVRELAWNAVPGARTLS